MPRVAIPCMVLSGSGMADFLEGGLMIRPRPMEKTPSAWKRIGHGKSTGRRREAIPSLRK